VRELLDAKANVTVLDNFLSGQHENLAEVKDSIKLIQGDVRDPTLFELLVKNKIEFVFNLAAMPYIPECYDQPADFFDINANGALNLLLACKKADVERIVQYSTSEVYGTGRQMPMDEYHPLHPQSTYAVAKLAADRLCFTLFHEQKIPVIILRQFNVFGPRETHPYIIPELITQLSKSNKLRLGNIHALRDFTYVTDAAQAAVGLIKHEKAEGQVFNSGYGKEYSIKEIAEMTGKAMGYDSVQIEIEQSRVRPLDVEKLQASYFKLHRLTGWEPSVSFEDGLKKTVAWFNEHDQRWPWEKELHNTLAEKVKRFRKQNNSGAKL
ncbi:MAG TPA: GDP-mannose 4,6-dehydratase, partial [archaeon]|nr:GDP-mannose 4,6-dehydratase [archaeon]